MWRRPDPIQRQPERLLLLHIPEVPYCFLPPLLVALSSILLLHSHHVLNYTLPRSVCLVSWLTSNGLSVLRSLNTAIMAPPVHPFRDINLHASSSHYAFSSPSSPDSPALVFERPTGDLRLNDGPLSGAKRVSSIAGILGIIKLKLGRFCSAISSSVC